MSWMNWFAITTLVISSYAMGQPPKSCEFRNMKQQSLHFGRHHHGIPPALAKELGISEEIQKKVENAYFDANEALIEAQAKVKRARLALKKALSQVPVKEGHVMSKLEAVYKAKLAVRKNRMRLGFQVRKLLGQETWKKLFSKMSKPNFIEWRGGHEAYSSDFGCPKFPGGFGCSKFPGGWHSSCACMQGDVQSVEGDARR